MNVKDIEEFYNKGLLYFILGSLISADSLNSVEDCEKSLEMSEVLLNLMPQANIPENEKLKCIDLLKSGIEIIKQDLERFKNEEK